MCMHKVEFLSVSYLNLNPFSLANHHVRGLSDGSRKVVDSVVLLQAMAARAFRVRDETTTARVSDSQIEENYTIA